jgi:hypothetical protein
MNGRVFDRLGIRNGVGFASGERWEDPPCSLDVMLIDRRGDLADLGLRR